jgi:hypothetical protein
LQTRRRLSRRWRWKRERLGWELIELALVQMVLLLLIQVFLERRSGRDGLSRFLVNLGIGVAGVSLVSGSNVCEQSQAVIVKVED